MRLFSGHVLGRSPLSPSVPLDGSETVRGLRALERLSLADGASAQPAGGQHPTRAVPTGRRHYQRYKGPYLEQLALEDLQAAPKPWGAFVGSRTTYSVPASMAVLQERLEENLVAYLPNYLRLAVAILLLVMYLRPPALLGTAAVAASVYWNTRRALQRQARQAAAAAAAARGAQGGPAPARGSQTEEEAHPLTLLLTAATWLLVAYTRCLPMILLALALSAAAVLLHGVTRQAPSEVRHRGKQPLGFSLQEVLGRRPLPSPGADPALVFKQAWWLCQGWAARRGRWLLQRLRYYGTVARDALRFRSLR